MNLPTTARQHQRRAIAARRERVCALVERMSAAQNGAHIPAAILYAQACKEGYNFSSGTFVSDLLHLTQKEKLLQYTHANLHMGSAFAPRAKP